MRHKIVYHPDYGGIFLSDDFREKLAKRKGVSVEEIERYLYTDKNSKILRHDKDLVELVEKYHPAGLEIIEIDEDEYVLEDYDGAESITTRKSDNWFKIES